MVAIESFADSDFEDMQRPLDPQAARIVQLPLARVDAWAELTLSDLAEKGVDFSRAELAGGTVKTVESSGLVAGAAKSFAADKAGKVTNYGRKLELVRGALTVMLGRSVRAAGTRP